MKSIWTWLVNFWKALSTATPDTGGTSAGGGATVSYTDDKVVKAFIKHFTSYDGQRETNGKNRSPWIDKINKWIGVELGSPYCATSISYALMETEKELGIKINIPKTASSQSMWFKTPDKFKRNEPAYGRICVMYNLSNPTYGHVLICLSGADENGNFKTFECNTDSSGSRDGEGCMFSTRNIKGTLTKKIRGYIDISDDREEESPVDALPDTKLPDWKRIAELMELDKESAKLNYIDRVIENILKLRSRYEFVQSKANVPWYFTAALHFMEASNKMNGNMMNGQPINQVTTIVPKGYGPWNTWEESAIDAFKYDGLAAKPKEFWTFGNMLMSAEKYNGLGYRKRGILSPYVTSFTNMSNEVGGFPRDHVYDPAYKHDRPSVGSILLRMHERNIIKIK